MSDTEHHDTVFHIVCTDPQARQELLDLLAKWHGEKPHSLFVDHEESLLSFGLDRRPASEQTKWSEQTFEMWAVGWVNFDGAKMYPPVYETGPYAAYFSEDVADANRPDENCDLACIQVRVAKPTLDELVVPDPEAAQRNGQP